MSNFFSTLVIGDNPDEIISKYNINKEVNEPYIIYKYSDLHKIRKNRIKIYEEFLKTLDNPLNKAQISTQISKLENMSDEEYYNEIGDLYGYDERMNIISDDNPFGEFIFSEKGGKYFNDFLIDVNGKYTTSDIKSHIAWDKLHFNIDKLKVYDRTWELCVNKITPVDDYDKNIIKNMSNYKGYFDKFKDKNDFIAKSTSFFTFAVCTEDSWYDADKFNNENWDIIFYDMFIKDLPDNKLITIYECWK